jgi:hypothetical protein
MLLLAPVNWINKVKLLLTNILCELAECTAVNSCCYCSIISYYCKALAHHNLAATLRRAAAAAAACSYCSNIPCWCVPTLWLAASATAAAAATEATPLPDARHDAP